MKSDEYSIDDGKRRSPDYTKNEMFARSKKMPRTSEKKQKGEEKLDALMIIMKTLVQDVKKIRKQQKDYQEEIRQLKIVNKEIKKEIEILKNEIKKMTIRLETIEGEKRKNNVVIQGLGIDTTNGKEIKEEIKSFIEKQLGMDVEIKNAKKLGNKACLLELGSETEKQEIMKNKGKLKSIRNEKIYINDDMTKNERKVQGKIKSKNRIPKNNNR
ncbi:hypothetical protein ILUMI_04530 [Ignelater luminosus]|uniref:Uncharacterized protein n=1 Tax=Ignelater luminosus TaxID=2038154 RepID=A0A8K0DDP8_IGNLU|nr:hypothetical protein ILUMI_04530 [Ignelater luminosus]